VAEDPRYDDEQRRLKDELEGGTAIDEDGRPVEAEPEVNPEVYRDCEPLLFKGFVYQSASINDVPFVFKSLNHHEFELIRLTAGGLRGVKATRRFYDLFLAYGVLAIDGQFILPERDRFLPDVADFFAEMVGGARQQVVRQLSELNRRAAVAVTLSEAYATEAYSRHRWSQLKGVDLTQPAVTGLPGTERLGLNWGQLAWVAFNRYEDLKFDLESNWENTKFVAGAFAGKGINSVHASDRNRRKDERRERRERKDRILRHAIYGTDINATTHDGQQIVVANTVEQLADQLERDLRGEKDWHDRVVHHHEQQSQREHQNRMAQLKRLQEEYDQKHGDQRVAGGTTLQGLSASEVTERIMRRRQLSAQNLASRMIVPPEIADERQANFARKWHEDRVPAGQRPVQVVDRSDPEALPAVTKKPSLGQPFRRG
jgi:hypothetical protein